VNRARQHNALGVLALLKVPSDAAHGELETHLAEQLTTFLPLAASAECGSLAVFVVEVFGEESRREW
jgi:hypothetical protein